MRLSPVHRDGVCQISAVPRHMRKQCQSGLSLVETLMALALASLMITGATILYIRSHTDTKITVGYQQYILVQKSVRDLFAGQATFSNLDNDMLDNSGALPSEIATGALGEFRNTWGGAITVVTNAANNKRFDVSFEGVPPEACTRIVSYSGQQSGTTDGVAQIVVTANGADEVFDTFPPNVPAVVVACDDDNAEATITWTL
jgi:Tfp pilus assembly protein PilV